MPRTIEHEPLSRHTAVLYAGDFDRLAACFPKAGPTVAMRRIIRSFLDKIDEKMPMPTIELKDEIDV